jgi:xanthine dehydrogenase YagR molybdenum-binding subunit
MRPAWSGPSQGEIGAPNEKHVGDFAKAFAAAPVKVDETYTVPEQAHAMMERHASTAIWDGDRVTCWTSIQQKSWGTRDLGLILGIPKENVHLISPYIVDVFWGKGPSRSISRWQQ